MSDTTNDTMCPTDGVLHNYVDERSELSNQERKAIDVHLDDCAACADSAVELRRYRTLLLRTRVPGLDAEQWQVLDERVQMMGTEYVPPESRFGRVYWGVAAMAAVGLLAAGAWHLLNVAPSTASDNVNVAKAPTQRQRTSAALQIGAVEGQLQVADVGGNWQALRAGEELRRGTTLRVTDGEGRLTIPGHARLRLAANSEARVLVADGHSFFLRLRTGEIGCQVDKRQPGQGFAIMAGRFRATVVGTEFIVRHNNRASVTVRVTEGAVRVDEAEAPRSRISETTTVVRAGNQWRFAGGNVDFGPIAERPTAPAPQAVLKVEEQAAPAPAVAPVAKQAVAPRNTARKARPAADPAQIEGRKIIIHIPPQRMPDAEVDRLKSLERLLFGPGGRESREQDGTDTAPAP